MILTAAGEDTAIAVEVVPGQTHDAPLLEPMLEKALGRVPVIVELVADKGFDGDPQRHACIERDVAPVIPNKSNRIEPWPFDAVVYRGRNKVERLMGKLKQFRRMATRYEKLKTMFLGGSISPSGSSDSDESPTSTRLMSCSLNEPDGRHVPHSSGEGPQLLGEQPEAPGT